MDQPQKPHRPDPKTTVVMPYTLKGKKVWLLISSKRNEDNDELYRSELPMGFMPRDGDEMPEFDSNDVLFAVANRLYNIMRERGMTMAEQLEKSEESSRWDQIAADDD